jgi:outer membrane receptor for monomeric catechols
LFLVDQKYLFRRNSGEDKESPDKINSAKYTLPVRKMDSVQVESVLEESVLKEDQATAKLDLLQKILHQEEG